MDLLSLERRLEALHARGALTDDELSLERDALQAHFRLVEEGSTALPLFAGKRRVLALAAAGACILLAGGYSLIFRKPFEGQIGKPSVIEREPGVISGQENPSPPEETDPSSNLARTPPDTLPSEQAPPPTAPIPQSDFRAQNPVSSSQNEATVVNAPPPMVRVNIAPQTRAVLLRGNITPDDYPPAARAMGAQGVVGVNIDIDDAGRPARCTVVQSSGNDDLDTGTCDLIRRRFSFSPARDREGLPTVDMVLKHIAWTLN